MRVKKVNKSLTTLPVKRANEINKNNEKEKRKKINTILLSSSQYTAYTKTHQNNNQPNVKKEEVGLH